MRRRAPAPTPLLDKLLDAAVEIRQDPDAVERSYMARQLVQCTLPHSDPGNVPQWIRKNGGLTLAIQPLRDRKTGDALYPYGTYPRLLLFWIVTEATRTKNRRLYLGHSLSDFMEKLGLPIHSGGKHGPPKRLREQMVRLLRAQISFEQTFGNGGNYVDMQVAPLASLWWSPSPSDGEQGALFDSWIELGELFFEAVTASPVPLDMRALRNLKKSPLALDLYAWFSYKAFTCTKAKRSQQVSWEGLHAQMGAEYAELRMFKFNVLKATAKIKQVFPSLNVDTTGSDYLIVNPSRPSVAPRSAK